MSLNSKPVHSKRNQALKFSFLSLEKEGLILESRNVPEKR